MTSDPSILSFIFNASAVVKVVLFILISASVFSWMVIFQRVNLFKQTHSTLKQFETEFWSGTSLEELYIRFKNASESDGLPSIFIAGLKEFKRLKEHPNMTPEAIMDGTVRAMRISEIRELDRLENNLSFLATVGSTSPYVGLFGTVWGIMTSFQSLALSNQQATIAMVAPGISEALIATAVGLFAAIPAVIAYNRFSAQFDKIQEQYEIFQEEFTNILHREVY